MTTLSASAPFYAPDGLTYDSLPHDPRLKSSAGAVMAIINLFSRGGSAPVLTDKTLARMIPGRSAETGGKSVATIQRALAYLESAGLIQRRWDDARKCRTIHRLISLKGSRDRAPKSKKANGLGPKKFGPPLLKNEQDPCSNLISAPSLLEGEQEKATGAGAADAGGGAPSSSPAGGEPDAGGEEPKPTPEEIAAFFRSLARGGPLLKDAPPGPPPPPPPRGPRRDRPVEPAPAVEEPPEEPPGDPIVRGVWEARRAAIAAATADQLADLAAMGDRAARAELNRRHRLAVEAARLEAATRETVEGFARHGDPIPAPRAEPPDPSPAAVAPGRPEVRPRGRDSPGPPRRGILGRLFGRG